MILTLTEDVCMDILIIIATVGAGVVILALIVLLVWLFVQLFKTRGKI